MRNWKQIITITLALGVTISTSVQAAEQANTTSIGIMAGKMTYDNDRAVNNTKAYALTLGHNLTDHWGFEGLVANVNSNANAGGKVDGFLYGISTLYNFSTTSKLQPYVSAGLSSLVIDTPSALSGTDTGFSFGGGLKYSLTNNVILRGDVRSMRTKDEFNDISYMVGLAYTFNKIATAVPNPIPMPPPMPMDSDKDGVYDNHDNCPNTPMNLAVDSRGCPIMEMGNLGIDLKVEFDTNKSDIKTNYNARIAEVAAFMKQYPSTNTTIEGHTDDRGSNEYNADLSQRRADSVRNYMIEKEGIAADRLTTVGYGEERPIADNSSAAGQQQNRRVMAVINTQVRNAKKR